MILIVSVLAERPEDASFYRWLKLAFWPEKIFYWGTGHQGIFKGRHKLLVWNLEQNGSPAANFSPAAAVRDLAKHSLRLQLLAKQSFEKGSPDETIRKFAGLCEQVLDELKPSLVFVVNPLIPHTSIPQEIATARGIPTVTFERGFLPQSFILDPGGYAGFSPFARQPLDRFVGANDFERRRQRGDGIIQGAKKQHWVRGATATANADHSLNLTDKNHRSPKVLVLGGADVNNAIYPIDHAERKVNSPAFEDTVDIVRQTATAHEGTTVFKPHPNTYAMLKTLKLPENVVLATNPIDALVEWADVVIVNGTSLEHAVLAANKPVVNCGITLLTTKGICYEVETAAVLGERIREAAARIGFETKLQHYQAFLGYVADDYLIFPETAHFPIGFLQTILPRSFVNRSWTFGRLQSIVRVRAKVAAMVRAIRPAKNKGVSAATK